MTNTTKVVLASVAGVTVLVAIVAGVGFAYLLSISGRPNVQICDQAMTYDEVKATWQMLPSTASNIWTASASVGMGGRARLYRFDAPNSDCLAYAAQLITKSNGDSDTNHQVSTKLFAISDPPSAIEARMKKVYGLETIDWFDVETIRTGFTGRGPPSGLSSFWVDTEKHRFYYYWTD